MSDTITIVGFVGTDPEKKITNGLTITTFRVGSTQRRLDRATGAWVDGETNWYTVSAYRKLAEHVFASVRRKERVIVTGRLRVRNWESGDKRGTSVEIDVDAIGHDLLFGTSAFTRDAPVVASAPPQSEDGWAPADAAEATEPEDAGSGAASAAEPALAVAQTPF